MKDLSSAAWMLLAIAVTFCLLPLLSVGQVQGNNAVYNSSGTCSPTCAASPAFIDASVFVGQPGKGSDLCDVIYKILNGTDYNYPSAGAVIDARGIGGSALTCTKGSPWSESGTSVSAPSTILLPATGGGSNFTPIVISIGWVLPANTHLFGQGQPGLAAQRRGLGGRRRQPAFRHISAHQPPPHGDHPRTRGRAERRPGVRRSRRKRQHGQWGLR